MTDSGKTNGRGDWDYVIGVCMIVGGVGLFVLSVFALWVLP